MSEPKVKIGNTGGLYIHAMCFEKAGDENIGHSHDYDHHNLVTRGRVRVEVEGRTTEIGEFELVFVKRGLSHKFTALEDNTIAVCLSILKSEDDSGDILGIVP
jgi:quercetin dioxygenase-like cupin family protein